MAQTDATHPVNPFLSYVRERIDAIADRKSEQEIAEAIGYERGETIGRIKNGEARLPLDKVGALAKALDADGLYLAHLWLVGHVPADAELFRPLLTPNENEVLKVVREASHHTDPVVTEERRRQLAAIFRCEVIQN